MIIRSQENIGHIHGGIVGLLKYGNLSQCCNQGSIISRYGCAGGIVGFSDINVTSCYNLGSVNGTDGERSTNIGGIVGRINNAMVKGTYNVGTINTAKAYIGGITGQNNNSEVRNSYNAGNVTILNTTKPSNTIGGANNYIGYITGYNLGTCSNQIANVTTSTLKGWTSSNITTNLGSDFKKGTDYPKLNWE